MNRELGAEIRALNDLARRLTPFVKNRIRAKKNRARMGKLILTRDEPRAAADAGEGAGAKDSAQGNSIWSLCRKIGALLWPGSWR